MNNSLNKSRGSELVVNTTILAIGRLVPSLISFLMLPIYTRFIDPTDFGTVDLINSYILLLIPIILLRLDIGIFRYVISARNNTKAISKILTNTLIMILPLIVLASIVVIIGGIIGLLPFAGAIALNVLAQIVQSIIGQLARGLGHNKLYALSATVGSLVNLVLGWLFIVVLELGGEGMLWALGISTLINSLIIIIALKPTQYIDKKLRDQSLRKELLRFSLPLVFENSSWWIMSTSDRTIITAILGAAANGIYAISNKVTNVANIFTSIFWMSWSESASAHVDDNDRDQFYSKTLNTYIRGFGSICLIAIAATPFLMKFFIGAEYDAAFYNIPILIIATFFSAIMGFLAAIYSALKMTKQIMVTSLVSAAVNLVIHLALINFIGLYAAAISTAISYATMTMHRYLGLRKKGLRVRIDKLPSLLLCLSAGVVCIMCYSGNSVVSIINVALACCIALMLNKSLITTVLRRIGQHARKSQ